jgi:hypothetical protein
MRQVWIGLVGVRKLAGCQILDETKGAFVNVLTVALSAQEFELKVQHWANELRLFVDEIEDAEPFEERIAKHEVTDELKELSDEAENRPNEVLFGAFHRYLHDDA